MEAADAVAARTDKQAQKTDKPGISIEARLGMCVVVILTCAFGFLVYRKFDARQQQLLTMKPATGAHNGADDNGADGANRYVLNADQVAEASGTHPASFEKTDAHAFAASHGQSMEDVELKLRTQQQPAPQSVAVQQDFVGQSASPQPQFAALDEPVVDESPAAAGMPSDDPFGGADSFAAADPFNAADPFAGAGTPDNNPDTSSSPGLLDNFGPSPEEIAASNSTTITDPDWPAMTEATPEPSPFAFGDETPTGDPAGSAVPGSQTGSPAARADALAAADRDPFAFAPEEFLAVSEGDSQTATVEPDQAFAAIPAAEDLSAVEEMVPLKPVDEAGFDSFVASQEPSAAAGDSDIASAFSIEQFSDDTHAEPSTAPGTEIAMLELPAFDGDFDPHSDSRRAPDPALAAEAASVRGDEFSSGASSATTTEVGSALPPLHIGSLEAKVNTDQSVPSTGGTPSFGAFPGRALLTATTASNSQLVPENNEGESGSTPAFNVRGFHYENDVRQVSHSTEACDICEVLPNDNYWSISKRAYGTVRYFSALALFNQHRISDPKKMRPGMKVLIPEAATLEARYPELFRDYQKKPKLPAGYFVRDDGQPAYRIGERETLSEIAEKHLGRSSRWIQIYRLNKSALADPNKLKTGSVILLPDDATNVQVLP